MPGLGLGLNKPRMLKRRYFNLVTNGDFANGMTGWIVSTSATAVVESGRLAITPSARYGYGGQSIATVANHKYYIASTVEGTTNNYMLVLVLGTISRLTSSGTQRLSNIFTATGTSHSIVFGDSNSSSWTKFYVDNVIALDLTATFGAGNEPTLEWCDANIPQNIVWT